MLTVENAVRKDIQIGARVVKAMKKHFIGGTFAKKNTFKIVKVACGGSGNLMGTLRLKNGFLRIYRTLYANAKTLLHRRFQK